MNPTETISATPKVPAAKWLEVMRDEYLRTYIPSGGGSVRFLSGPRHVLNDVSRQLVAEAARDNFHAVLLETNQFQDGARPDLHRIDKFFFAASDTLDWPRLAEKQVRGILQRNCGLFVPGDQPLRLESLAAANGCAVDDFEGNAMRVTDIRRKLRELNRAGDYPIRNPRAKLLAHDRLRLFAQLCRVCTGQGLVVFFDETERIRRFSRKQRFEAYREIGWWAEQAASPGSGILPVMAMIDAFVQETITAGLNDEAQLRDRPVADRMEQTRIQAGIDCLKRSERLEPTTMSQRDSIRERVRTLYQLAYQVDPDPAVTDPPNATTLRQYIRTWITRWDLARYYHEPVSIQADQLAWENNGFEEDAPPDAG